MDWLSNMAFIQHLSSNRSFFIAFDQYFLIFPPFDIWAAHKLRAQLLTPIPEPVRNRFKSRCLPSTRDFGELSRADQAEGAPSNVYQQREESDQGRRTMKCCRKKIACYWIACSFIFLKRSEGKSIAFSKNAKIFFSNSTLAIMTNFVA